MDLNKILISRGDDMKIFKWSLNIKNAKNMRENSNILNKTGRDFYLKEIKEVIESGMKMVEGEGAYDITISIPGIERVMINSIKPELDSLKCELEDLGYEVLISKLIDDVKYELIIDMMW